MPTPQDYFDMFSGRMPGEKQAQVDQASQQRAEELRRTTEPGQAFQAMAGARAGYGNDSASEQEKDLRTLSPYELEIKYGPDAAQMLQARVQADSRINNNNSMSRTGLQKIGDAALTGVGGIVTGFTNLAEWEAAETSHLVNRFTGSKEVPGMVTGLNKVNQFLNKAIAAGHSDAYTANAENLAAEKAQASRDNQHYYETRTDQNNWDAAYRELKNAKDTLTITGRNPGAFADLAAQGVGSIISGQILSKSLQAVGRGVLRGAAKGAVAVGAGESVAAGTAFKLATGAAEKYGSRVGMMASIGLQEGGGAYDQTYTEALNQLADRTDISDSQRNQLADQAATISARLQAPIGAVTGLLVARFEANPLAKVNFSKFLANNLREVTEESIQGATGQMSQNYGIDQRINTDTELSAGVGDQVALSALGALGSTGAIGAPGLAVQTALDAAVGTGRAIGKGASTLLAPYAARGAAMADAARAAAPFSRENVANMFETITPNLGEMAQKAKAAVEGLTVPDNIKAKVSEYAGKVMDAVSKVDFSSLSGLADLIRDKTKPDHDRLAATLAITDQTDAHKALLDEQAGLLNGETVPGVQEANDALGAVTQNPEVAKAIKEGTKLAGTTTISSEDVASPENIVPIQAAIAKAQLAPETADPAVNKIVLKHAEDGKINITPMQLASLKSSTALVEAQTENKAAQKSVGKINVAGVSNVLQEEATQALGAINDAMRRSDTSGAKMRLEDLSKVAELFRNKLAALNEHLASGTGSNRNAVGYQNLIGEVGNRKWIPAEQGLWANAKVPKSMAYVEGVTNDARSMTTLVNNLARIFPELGVKPTDEVISAAPTAAPTPTPTPAEAAPKAAPVVEASAETKSEVSAVEPAAKPTPEPKTKTTPEAVAPAQPKGGDTSTKVEAKPKAKVDTDKLLERRLEIQQEIVGITEGLNEASDVLDDDQVAEVEQSSAEATAKLRAEMDAIDEQLKAAGIAKPSRAEVLEKTGTKVAENPIGRVTVKTDLAEKPKVEPLANLISDLFKQAFKAPDAARTRTIGSQRPLQTIFNALKSKEAFLEFIGKKSITHDMTPELASEYQSYVRDVGASLGNRLNAQLDHFLDKNAYGPRQHLLDGTKPVTQGTKTNPSHEVDLMTMVNGKGLNIVQNIDGKLSYDPELLGGAILAGLQWMLLPSKHWAKMDREAVSKVFNIPTSNNAVDRLTTEMNNGMGIVEMKRSLAAQIVRFWGVSTNKSADLALVNGISETIAAELILAMTDDGLFKKITVVATVDDGVGVRSVTENDTDYLSDNQDPQQAPENSKMTKRVDRYVPILSRMDGLAGWPTAIEEAVQIDPETNFIGAPPTKVAASQLNNSRAYNTKNGKQALANENTTPYFLNTFMNTFVQQLEKAGVQMLFGGGDITNQKLNFNTKATLEGRNATFVGAFNTMLSTVAEMTSVATASETSVDQVPVHFDHNFSSIGRMQQQGRNNPQSSKLMREILLPTWSTRDLSDPKSTANKWFNLALAQALGVKVNKQNIDKSANDVLARLNDAEDLKPIVDMFQDWLGDTSQPMADEDLLAIKEKLGNDSTPLAVHAIMEYARLQNAKDKTAFRTALYIEADGVSNGVANAMAMLTPGGFTSQWINMIAKVGMFIGSKIGSMNAHRETPEGETDVYETMATTLSNELSFLHTKFLQNGDTALAYHLESLMSLMTMLKPKDFEQRSRADWLISRNVAKNPMTILLYGSSTYGIAGNVTKDITDAIYQKISDASVAMQSDKNLTMAEAMFGKQATGDMTAEQMLSNFENKLNTLMSSVASTNERGTKLRNLKPITISFKGINPETFKFNAEGIERLSRNVLTMFVDPMSEAIKKTVGSEVIESMTNLRKATQIQSIFYEAAYKREVARAMKGKASNEFLSQQEMDAIHERIAYLAPVIETGEQRFDIAGSEKTNVRPNEFGRSMSVDGARELRTDAYMYTPTNSGVSGLPKLNIGMGDGYMMQRMATAKNAVKRTLKIFDGVNLGLDQIEEGSRQANEAALGSWNNNPLLEVSKMFDAFLKDVPTSEFSEQQLEDLGKALFDKTEREKGLSIPKIMAEMKRINVQLKSQSLTAEARHRALARVNLTVDQMATTGNPHIQEGTIDLSGMNERDQAIVLNKLYIEELEKLTAEDEVRQKVGSDLLALGTVDESSGVRVIDAVDLSHTLTAAKILPEQKALLGDIIKSMKADGYRVVIGVPWRLQQYSLEIGNGELGIKDHDHGFAMPDQKMIYITSRNPTAETVVHELIHAATFETVLNHYENVGNREDKTPNRVETARAVGRIEIMMDQFLGLDANALNEANPEMVRAYNDAKAAIQDWQNKSDQPMAVRQAGALNEFMAWTLSNPELIRLAERTKVSPLVRIAKEVIHALKTLIFGKRNISPKAWADMHSNLRFNTAVLMNAVPSVPSLLNGVTLFQSTAQSKSSTLLKAEQAFQERVVQFLDVELPDQNARDKLRDDAYITAYDVGQDFKNHGFYMTPDESRAFLSILGALVTVKNINGNIMAEAQRMYSMVVANIKPSDFLVDPTSTDQNDLALAQDRYDVTVGRYSTQKDSYGRSAMLASFIAMSMVSDDMKMALKRVKVDDLGLAKWNTMDGIIDNVGIVAMDALGTIMAGGDRRAKNVDEAMQSLAAYLVKVAQVEQTNVVSRGLNMFSDVVSKGNDIAVRGFSALSNAGVALANKGLARKNNSSFTRLLLESGKALASTLSEPNAQANAMFLISVSNNSKLMPRWTHELLNEVIGRTEENAPVYDMIKAVRSWVQQTRQMFREKLPQILTEAFTKPPSVEDHLHMARGMGKSDLAGLITSGIFTEEQTMDLLKNQKQVPLEIIASEDRLDALDPKQAKNWIIKAKELAKYMNTREVPPFLLRNAHAIAAGIDTKTGTMNDILNVDPKVVKEIDALVSLYAMDTLEQVTKDALTRLAQDDTEGVRVSLSYLVGERNTELGKANGQSLKALTNHYKGYLPEAKKTRSSLIIGDVADENTYREFGFVKLQDYVGSKAEGNQPKRAYYFSDIGGKAPFSQGIMQHVRATYSGVDPNTGFTNDGQTAGLITDRAEVDRITKVMNLNNGKTENLMPIFSGHRIVAYERSFDPKMLAKIGHEEHLANSIGMWRGRQAEEHQAGQFNSALIQNLGERWRLDRATRKGEYINVYDEAEQLKDPVLRDAVSLLNRDTRAMVRTQFGKDEFWIRKDMLNDVLGYRQASISDLWTGNSRWSPETLTKVRNVVRGILGVDAYRRVLLAEQFVQNFIADARVTIVVKSIIVPVANMVSNIFQLMSRGVGIGDIALGMPRKTAEIDAFIKGRFRRIELEAMIRASTNDPAKITRLKAERQQILDMNRNLSIFPLIKAGEFSAISDVGITQEEISLVEGKLNAYMEGMTARLPKSLQTLARYGIVAKDTSLFKGLQRAVEYGDFLGKAVLYDHLTKKKKLTNEQALARITEEFVNYDRLAGRSRNYLENIGLMWFWNFKIRSIKIAMSMVRNNPLHALFAMSGHFASDAGSPLYDNAVTVGLDGRSHWSLGPRMSLHAHSLNPWWNLFT